MAKQRQITTLTGSAAEVLQALTQVRAADAVADQERLQRRRKGGMLTGVGCVGMFGSVFLMAIPPLGVVLLLAFIGVVLAGWGQLRRSGQLAALDLDNERLAVVSELIETLAPDLSDKKPLNLTLAHGTAVTWAPPTNQRQEGTWLTGKISFSEYQDTWLSLGGRMQDGSLFRLAVTETVKRKSKPKRKYTKLTDRCREEVTLVLRVSPAFYPHLDRLQAALHPDRLLSGTGLGVTQCQVNGPSIRVRAVTGLNTRQVLRYSRPETGQEHRIHTGKLIGLLAFVFAGLSHCRMDAQDPATAAAGGGGASPAAPTPATTPATS
jgi:hypothetical protein